jgi:hypothetical protein
VSAVSGSPSLRVLTSYWAAAGAAGLAALHPLHRWLLPQHPLLLLHLLLHSQVVGPHLLTPRLPSRCCGYGCWTLRGSSGLLLQPPRPLWLLQPLLLRWLLPAPACSA